MTTGNDSPVSRMGTGLDNDGREAGHRRNRDSRGNKDWTRIEKETVPAESYCVSSFRNNMIVGVSS